MHEEREKTGEERRSTDREELRLRLKSSGTAMEGEGRPSPPAQKKVLRERAKALADGAEKKEETEEHLVLTEFTICGESYAIEPVHIREVCPLKDITPLPCTPSFVLGIINLRGQILSVIDIRKLLSVPATGLSELNKVIILQSGQMELGILADDITGVRQISLREIQPPLLTLTDNHSEYLKGITGERLIILDAEKILSDKRIIVHDEVQI